MQGDIAQISVLLEADKLLEAGSHNLLVYDDLDGLLEIFVDCAKKFLPRNEIVILATQYDDIDNIKLHLENVGIDVSKHISEGTLFVIDAQKGYQGTDTYGTFKLAMSLMERTRKEGRTGMTWLGDMGSFFAFDKASELIGYELDCPTKYEDTMKTVCCYHRQDFNKLDSQQESTLIDHHFKSIFLH